MPFSDQYDPIIYKLQEQIKEEKSKALKWEQEASMYKSKVFKLDAKIMELEKKLNERS